MNTQTASVQGGFLTDTGSYSHDNAINFAPDAVENVLLDENLEIVVGDLEQVILGSANLNQCREELHALVKDLRSVLIEEA